MTRRQLFDMLAALVIAGGCKRAWIATPEIGVQTLLALLALEANHASHEFEWVMKHMEDSDGTNR